MFSSVKRGSSGKTCPFGTLCGLMSGWRLKKMCDTRGRCDLRPAKCQTLAVPSDGHRKPTGQFREFVFDYREAGRVGRGEARRPAGTTSQLRSPQPGPELAERQE